MPYMQDYVKTFTGTSITTDQWRSHLFHYFGSQSDGQEYLRRLGKVDWDNVSGQLSNSRLIYSGSTAMGSTCVWTCNTTTRCPSRVPIWRRDGRRPRRTRASWESSSHPIWMISLLSKRVSSGTAQYNMSLTRQSSSSTISKRLRHSHPRL